jgi:hypothetical protein
MNQADRDTPVHQRRHRNPDRLPSYATETDVVFTGQGKGLFDYFTCSKDFRLFTRAEGGEGHREGMAPIVFWTATFDWLDAKGMTPPRQRLLRAAASI